MRRYQHIAVRPRVYHWQQRQRRWRGVGEGVGVGCRRMRCKGHSPQAARRDWGGAARCCCCGCGCIRPA